MIGLHIGVIGAGTMGLGIAQIAAQAGCRVTVFDQSAQALARGGAAMDAALERMVAKGRLAADLRSEITGRVRWDDQLHALSNAHLVIEAIVERLDIKRDVFSALEQIVGADCILATNTSSLSVDAIASALRWPDRFCGLHFFNPVPVMRLVELIASSRTAPSVMTRAAKVMTAWGKQVIVARDVPGFIVNSVARPYYAEGFAALGDGIAPQDIDALMVEAGGFRIGPLALSDLIGQDINYAAAASVHSRIAGIARFELRREQAALVERGDLGQKTGRGVYDHGKPLPLPNWLTSEKPAPAHIQVHAADSPLQGLFTRLANSGICVERNDALPPDCFKLGECVIALGDGLPLAARPGVDMLLDLARDFATATALGVTALRGTDLNPLTAMFHRVGINLLLLPDRPGQVVLRSMVQLANAALDAANHGVASPEDIDKALILGANHPQGPIDWGCGYGIERLAVNLRHLASVLQSDAYLPSAASAK